MNSFEVLGQGSSMEEPSEKEVEFLQLKALNADVKVNISEEAFDTQTYPANVNLLACSSKFGYFVGGTPKGFALGQLSDLRSTFNKADKGAIATFPNKIEVPISQAAVHHLRLSAGQDQIIAGLADGTILVFEAKSISNKTKLQPSKSFTAGSPILDLRPNPEEKPDMIAVLLSNNTCQYMSLSSGFVLAKIQDNDITAICWSPKGKQITVGNRKGYMSQYDLEGKLKSAIEPPVAMTQKGGESADRYVQNLLWVENNVFLPIYAAPPSPDDEQPPHVYDGYIVTRQPKSTIKNYTRLTDICMPFGQQNRNGQYYMEVVKNLGQEAPYVILIASAPSASIGVVGQDKSGDWAVWELDDTARGNLPLSEQTDMDTSPFGLALDFSSTEPLEPLDPSEPENFVNPVPILYYLNDEVNMGAFHCLNVEAAKRNESYAGQIQAQSLSGGSVVAASTTTPAPVTAPATTPFAATASAPTATEAKTSPFTSTFGGPGGFGAVKATSNPAAPSTTAPSFGGFGTSAQAASTGFSFGSAGFGTKTQAPSSPGLTFTGTNLSTSQSKPSQSPSSFNFTMGGDNNKAPTSPFSATANVKSPSAKEATGFSFQATKSATASPTFSTTFAPAPGTAKPSFEASKGTSPLQTPSSFASSSPRSDISTASSVKVEKPPLTFGAAAASPKVSAAPAATKAAPAQTAASVVETEKKTVLKGMAREFESTYLTLNAELEKLHVIATASDKMNARDRPSNPSLNTLDALQNVDEWKLSDLKTQINLTRQLLEKMKGLQKDGESIKSHMSKLDREAVKNVHKQHEIKKFLDAKLDPSKLESTKTDHLGPEAQETLRKLEETTMEINDTFKKAEESTEQLKKNLLRNQKAYRGLSAPSTYTIHRTIREVRNGLFVHNIELDEIENKLNNLTMEEKPRPRAFSSRFSFDELINEEPVPLKAKAAETRKIQLPKASRQAINDASDVLMQESFLYRLSKSAAVRQPTVHKIATPPVIQRKIHEPLDASPLGIDVASLDFSDISTPRRFTTPIEEPDSLGVYDSEAEEDKEEQKEDDKTKFRKPTTKDESKSSKIAEPTTFGGFKALSPQQSTVSASQQQQAGFGPKFDSPSFSSRASTPFSFQSESSPTANVQSPPMFGVAASSTKPTFFGTMPAAKTSSEAPKFTGFGGTPSSESPWSSFASSFTGSELKQQPQLEKQDNVITSTAKTEKQDETLDKQDEPTTPSESDNSSFDVVGDERYGSEDEHSGFDHYDEGSESDIEDEGTHDEEEDSADDEDDVTEHERDEVVEVSAVSNKTKAEEPAQLETVEEAKNEEVKVEEVKAEEVEPEGVKIEEVESEPQQQPSPQAEEEGMRPEDEIELAMKDIGLVVPPTEDEPEDITVEESIEEPAPAFKIAETSDANALTEGFGSKISFGTSATSSPFGSKGITASTSSFGTTISAPAPAFGSTAPAPAPAPAFGTTTATSSAFGSSTSDSSPFGASVSSASPGFGSTTTSVPAFGHGTSAPAFGSATSVPAFASSTAAPTAFGGTGSTPSAFGSSAPFGSQPPAPAFGSTAPLGTQGSQTGFGSSAGGFGSAAPAFGSTTPFGAAAAAPAFGSTSNLGSTGASFGATSSLGTPGFGATSSLGGNAFGRGFGSAPKTTFGSTTSFGSGGGFSSAAQAGSGFGAAAQQGQNVFANQPSNTNAFGSSAPFGQQQQQQNRPFGSNPAFTQFRG